MAYSDFDEPKEIDKRGILQDLHGGELGTQDLSGQTTSNWDFEQTGKGYMPKVNLFPKTNPSQ